MKTASEIIGALQRDGHKKTKVRELLIARLIAVKKPLDAMAMGEFLEKKGIAVNKTTVYREIQFLEAKGIIVEINFGDGKKRYEIAGLPHHHHLVCSGCSRIEDIFAERDLSALERKIEKETSFAIKSHSLEFFGLCAACKKV